MDKTLVAVALLAIAAGGASTAQADSHQRIVEVWTCSLNEGKTQADVEAANGKWVKLMNEKIEGGDIHSYVLTPIVGDTGTFLYADSYPSMEAWVASKVVIETEAGQAVEQELDAAADCSSNTLHRSTAS